MNNWYPIPFDTSLIITTSDYLLLNIYTIILYIFYSLLCYLGLNLFITLIRGRR